MLETGNTKHEYFLIVEVTPGENGDYIRLVEIFETRQDAETVLTALESINYLFKYYKIIGKDT